MNLILILNFIIVFNIMISYACYVTNINIESTGLLMPYSLGILGYIKKHIHIPKYNLNGVSGGAWCSLLYHYENDMSDHDKLWELIVGNKDYKVCITRNMNEFQSLVINNLLKRYKDESIKDVPINVIVSKVHKNPFNITNIKINKYVNMHDLINLCHCSSYIPYLSGKTLSTKYKDSDYIDGAVRRNVDLFDMNGRTIYIHKNMWARQFQLRSNLYLDINTSRLLFEHGWNDTEKNKDKLLHLGDIIQ